MNELEEYLIYMSQSHECLSKDRIKKILALAEDVYGKKSDGLELTDLNHEEVARQVRSGCTSGIIDYEDENGTPVRISWELTTNKFLND